VGDINPSGTTIQGVRVIERERYSDQRGSFERFFDGSVVGGRWMNSVQQCNFAITKGKGTVRGLHLQLPPHTEWKSVSCIQGAVFDVVVDLRVRSSTFGKWFGITLSHDNRQSLLVPPGCAHGMQALSSECALAYVHSSSYEPSAEAGLNPTDEQVGIVWPLAVRHLSDRDKWESRSLEYFREISW
jgi:dTDP-4-dehydrorhamnose 3,5-epimerase